MSVRDLGKALTMIMNERGWTQTRLGQELGQSQDWVSDIIRGKRDTFVRKAARLLDKVDWELRIAPKSDKRGMEDDPVKRREFVTGTVSALLISPPKTTPYHDPAFVKELTRRQTYVHYQMGSNSLATTLVRQARKIRVASATGSRALQSAASEFMRQGVWIVRQAGRPDLAIQFANNALHFAERAEDPDNLARAYSALGYVGMDPDALQAARRLHHDHSCSTLGISSKNAGRAVEYARRGLDVPGIGNESRAFLTGLLAWGLANVPGQERQAHTHIDQALNIDKLSAIGRADVVGIAGNVLHDTGERREGLKLLQEAIDFGMSYSPYLSARYLGDQIMIALDMRDASYAASLMNTLSCMVPLVDSTVLDRKVQQILHAAKPWSAVREIHEARERLHAVRLTSGARTAHIYR